MEAEYTALAEHFMKPSPEPNSSVRYFDKLSVQRWEAHLSNADLQRERFPPKVL